LQDVHKNAQGRQIFFSSFHPDAAQVVRKLQELIFLVSAALTLLVVQRKQ
jgi:hypothetical protein